jgi:hypothetical protein
MLADTLIRLLVDFLQSEEVCLLPAPSTFFLLGLCALDGLDQAKELVPPPPTLKAGRDFGDTPVDV